MLWTDLLTPFPGGNRRAALIGFRASLKKLDSLAEAAINNEEALEHYWADIVEETHGLKRQLITREEEQYDQSLSRIHYNRELIKAVRERDGDTCRFCGETVNWKARHSALAGTYIPLQMDKPIQDPNETFVGCRPCAAHRKRDFKEGKPLKAPNPLGKA